MPDPSPQPQPRAVAPVYIGKGVGSIPLYRLADLSGQVWEGVDLLHLREWVRLQNVRIGYEAEPTVDPSSDPIPPEPDPSPDPSPVPTA